MQNLIKGLHHLTATVNDAQEDYDFYILNKFPRILGSIDRSPNPGPDSLIASY